MRNTLIAAAVLGTLSAAASAADNVTLYGQVNVGVVVDKTTSVSKTKVDNLYTGSRLGFKGEEDLGDGLKAVFQIEQGLRPDDAATSATTNSFGSREAWVGLQGGFGKVALGRGKTPYTNISDLFEIFDGSSLALAIYGVDSVTNAGTQNGLISAGGARLNNAIRYDSPNLSGFTSAVMYSVGENKSDTLSESKNASLSARYVFGNYSVFGAYSALTNVGDTTGADNTAYLLGASAKFDALTLQAAYQNGQKETATAKTVDRDSFVATAAYVLGATTFKAGLIVAGDNDALPATTADKGAFNQYALGVKYALSKRTNLIAEYERKDFDADTSFDQSTFALGVMHSF